MDDVQATPRGLSPRDLIDGEVRVPGSKSIAQRMLLLGALSPGPLELVGDTSSDDVGHMLATLGALGLAPEARGPGQLAWGPGITPARPGPLQLGESGTAARLWLALAGLGALGAEPRELLAQGSLRKRRSTALVTALRGAGASVTPQSPTCGDFPLRLQPAAATQAAEIHLEAPASSQEITGLLLALAWRGGGECLRVSGQIPSEPYVELTLAVLRDFGIETEVESLPNGRRYRPTGQLAPHASQLSIEPDASAAGVALAAGCLSGGQARISGLGPAALQGDIRIAEHLRAFGCCADFHGSALVASGAPQRGARLNLEGEPDLAPVLAAVASAAALSGKGPSRLTGLGTLPGKESDRLAVLCSGLGALGVQIEADRESLTIRGGQAHGRSLVLDPDGDHRMAFAFALMGLVVEGVLVRQPGCVAKSWPGFWKDMAGDGPANSTI